MTTKIFDSMGLSPRVMKAIKRLGYAAPLPVQAQAIPLIRAGSDVLATAQTGSGKTAAFAIPIFDFLLRSEEARALVIAPTRELAEQIYKVFNDLAAGAQIPTALIVGGKFMQNQLRKLKNKPRFIAGTPGRLNDHILRKSLVLDAFKIVVWDEMDRMLELGFIHQIEHIVSKLPADKQTLMFSATLPKRVEVLAQKYLQNPQRVMVDDTHRASRNVAQEVIFIEAAKKPAKLAQLLAEEPGQVIVFTKTQKMADMVARQLARGGGSVAALHGAMRQSARGAAVAAFRAGATRVLVATDVAARGLDIAQIACVINYELPQAPQEYIHRVGRTGRVSARGRAVSLIAKAERGKWKEIEEFLQGKEQPAAHESPALAKESPALAQGPAAPAPQTPFPLKHKQAVKKKFGFSAALAPERASAAQPQPQPKAKPPRRPKPKHWGKIFAKAAKRSPRGRR